MATNLEKIAKKQKSKAKGHKVAEVIWITIGAILMICGIGCLVLSVIINNIGSESTVIYNSPLYPLVEAQENFKIWWNKWCFMKFTTFGTMGMWLVIISCAYLLLVFGIYASKQDVQDKKDKAKKLRERNALKFKEEQNAATNAVQESAPATNN